MACTLTISIKPGIAFEGVTGTLFTITIVPVPGSTLSQAAADYNGTTIVGPVATFPVAHGIHALTITYAAAALGERGSLAEICPGGAKTPLRGIRSTAIFTRQYVIEGA